MMSRTPSLRSHPAHTFSQSIPLGLTCLPAPLTYHVPPSSPCTSSIRQTSSIIPLCCRFPCILSACKTFCHADRSDLSSRTTSAATPTSLTNFANTPCLKAVFGADPLVSVLVLLLHRVSFASSPHFRWRLESYAWCSISC